MSNADWRDRLRTLIPDDYEPEPTQPASAPEPPKPALTISVDRKRAGKVATIVAGWDADDPRAEEASRALKRKLGAGGSSRGGEVLIQGDRAQAVALALREMGYKVKGQGMKI